MNLSGNDIDGYKTTMPVIHTATHLGWHPIFGPPTGKRLRWSGIPNCFIKNIDGQWKYTAEWNLPGNESRGKLISTQNLRRISTYNYKAYTEHKTLIFLNVCGHI